MNPDPSRQSSTDVPQKKKTRIPHKFMPWINARNKFGLSHTAIQMARELGMDPKKFVQPKSPEPRPGRLPLEQYIQRLYQARFGRPTVEQLMTIEEMASAHVARREAKKAQRDHDSIAADD